MPNPINMFHISVYSASRQAPWIFSILDRWHSISGLCRTIKYYSLLIASSLKANVNFWKVSAPILPTGNNNLMHMNCSLKSVIFWRNKNCTGHNTWLHFTAVHSTTLYQQQTTMQVLLHCNIDDGSVLTAAVVVGTVWQVTAWWWRSAQQNKYYETYF